jgi:predicted transcriptional regulator of viral defense system
VKKGEAKRVRQGWYVLLAKVVRAREGKTVREVIMQVLTAAGTPVRLRAIRGLLPDTVSDERLSFLLGRLVKLGAVERVERGVYRLSRLEEVTS